MLQFIYFPLGFLSLCYKLLLTLLLTRYYRMNQLLHLSSTFHHVWFIRYIKTKLYKVNLFNQIKDDTVDRKFSLLKVEGDI